MTYEEATAKVGELKERFDSPFDASDKAVIESDKSWTKTWENLPKYKEGKEYKEG